MALPVHIPILKAKEGEFKAISRLDDVTSRKIIPMFEMGRITESIRERKYFRDSRTPVTSYLDRIIDKANEAWAGRPAMVDGFEWPANARTERGDHVIAYMVARMRALHMPITPVVGYDRWADLEYRAAMRSIEPGSGGAVCFRLDSTAIDDAAEPEHFQDVISNMLSSLDLHAASCPALLDFGDVSIDSMSVEKIVASASDVIRQLHSLGFIRFIVAGCSMPRSIDLAVDSQDTDGFLLRKEALVWQSLRFEFPSLSIMSGDYGLRGPTTAEVRSRYTNGKIRYSVRNQMHIIRGHPFINDHSFVQMKDLAERLIRTNSYIGSSFSWGDDQILLCTLGLASGNLSHWIAVDTNHHLVFVVQEAEEFERAFRRQGAEQAR